MSKHLIHAHSSTVTEGAPNLPSANRIEYGEIAINYAKGHETISIKNSNNEIVTFPNAIEVQDNLDKTEKVIASALNDINDRLDDHDDSIDGLSTVAVSGSYNDLINKPTIPSPQVQADWNQSTSTSIDYIKNKPTNVSSFTNDSGYVTGTKIYVGTCSSAAKTYAKVATVETFPTVTETVDNVEVTKPISGTVIAVKYVNSNTYKTSGHTYTLNVNNTGAYPMYYNADELPTSSTSANTLVAGYANRHVFYMFDGSHWVFLSASYDANSTYSAMTQAEITAGTSTTSRLMTPKLLRDNFYTKGEVDNQLTPLTPTDSITEDSTYPITSGAVYDAIVSNEKIVSSALNDLNNRVSQLETIIANLNARIALLES